METRPHDHRRHGRYRRAARVSLDFHHGAGPREATTVDLSQEGAAFHAEGTVAPAAPVILCLRLERHGPPLEAKGKVCWSRSQPDGAHHFGIRFLDLSEDERARLVAFLGERG